MSERFNFFGLRLSQKRGRELLHYFCSMRFLQFIDDSVVVSKRLELDILNLFHFLRETLRRDPVPPNTCHCLDVSFDVCYLEEFDNLLRDISLHYAITGTYKSAVFSILLEVVETLCCELNANLE